ncbi:MAG: hypothetical protein LDL39_05080 [Magnetospirillum sp.]|nr:hypothetical protein [Magnetospirillum sp.]
MARSFNPFKSKKPSAKADAVADETANNLPVVQAETAVEAACDTALPTDCELDGMAAEAIGKLASIVLDRNQAPNNQHGVHAEISLMDCSLPAPNGDRADLIAHGGKVVLEFQGCSYVPRSLNSGLNCHKPTSVEVEISVTTARQSERQGEASGEFSAETAMEGGMTGFKGSAKMAGKAAGKTGRKDGDAASQVASTKVPQQIISGSSHRKRVEITIDPLRHANGEAVRSHGRLWNDQVAVVKVEEDESSVSAYFQTYRDGDVMLTGGTGVFAEPRNIEQQKVVDMLFRRMLSSGRRLMDELPLPRQKDDKNG